MPDELVLIQKSSGIAKVTLNRPDKLNALSQEVREELDLRFREIGADEEVKAVVLTGAGRAFSAGADLSGGGLPRDEMGILASFEETAQRQKRMLTMPQPLIAAVNGYCLGRGLEVALWCDIIVAAESAKFGQPEVRDGSLVATIIPWLTSPQRAKLFLLTGDTVDAATAYEMGLVAQVVSGDDALPAALSLAKRISHVPPPTARAVKSYVNDALELQGLYSVQKYGNAMGTLLHALPDSELGEDHLNLKKVRESDGLRAYLNARDAPFKIGESNN